MRHWISGPRCPLSWFTRGADPFGNRRPTSHERLAGQPWDASYHGGPAPWDIGRPQPAVVRLAAAGAFTGAVLDAGCGTGENALHVAALGLPVLGLDVAETALAIARQKAEDRRLRLLARLPGPTRRLVPWPGEPGWGRHHAQGESFPVRGHRCRRVCPGLLSAPRLDYQVGWRIVRIGTDSLTRPS
jgi:SAM-dependent methyltransferase